MQKQTKSERNTLRLLKQGWRKPLSLVYRWAENLYQSTTNEVSKYEKLTEIRVLSSLKEGIPAPQHQNFSADFKPWAHLFYVFE